MPTGCPSVVSLFHPVSPTGKTIWTLNLIHLSSGFLAAPAAILPDVDGDGTRDIVVLALKETQVQHSPVWGLKGPCLSRGRIGRLMWKTVTGTATAPNIHSLRFPWKAPFFFQSSEIKQ